MYAMEDEGLNGIAFLDVSFLVVSISAVKNFILISDAFKSVWFVVFQEEPPKIILLGKDLYPVQVFGSEFMIGGKELAMLVSDDKKNLHVMSYEPFSVQSLGGQRLLRRGEMNLGSEIQAFASIRLKSVKSESKLDMFGVVAGTAAGGLSMIIPVPEKMYKRLYGLYSRMVTHLEHHAGLNPRGFRQIILPVKSIHASSVITGPPGPRGILDGDLLFRFLHLSLVQQRELAKAIGSRDDRIIDDLLELSASLEYF
jgi:cleavage and polyadenylation specificity factor subunit 1